MKKSALAAGAKKPFKTGKGTDIVGVDLTSNHVRIVHAKKMTDKVVFEQLAGNKFGENADVEISQYLLSTYKSWGLRTRSAICVIPSKLFISKNVDMPSNDPEEISKIIDLQAGRYTPYSRDEIVIDYQCVRVPGQHYTNVLLAIINRKIVDRYLQIFEQAGLFVEAMAVASEGMAMMYRHWAEGQVKSGALAGIHIDEDSSDLTILNDGEMVFIRSLPLGASHFKANVQTTPVNFSTELSKSITAYQDHGIGQPVKGLVITGMTTGLDDLETVIRAQIPAMKDPVFWIKMMPYPNQFEMGKDVLGQIESAEHGSFFELMAVLAAGSVPKIDLIPKEIKLKRRFREGGKETMTLGILIMTCLLMVCLFLGSKIYLKNNLIAKLETSFESVSTESRILERASTKSRVLRTLLEHRGKGLYVFDKVISLIGGDIYLTSFNYAQEGKVHLLGTAESMSGVFAFVTKLEESGYFSSVTTNETKTRREGGKEVADFDIECVLIEEI